MSVSADEDDRQTEPANGAAESGLDRLSANLRVLHEEAGVPLPDDQALSAPLVYVGREKARPKLKDLLLQIVPLLAVSGLYRKGRDIGTVNEATGEFEEMGPHAFCSWIPTATNIVLYESVDKDPHGKIIKIEPGDLSVELARLILASHELRAKVPELKHVSLVPQPVYRSVLDEIDRSDPKGKAIDEKRKGFRKLELLKPGYDAATKTFTVHGGPVLDEKWDGMEAAQWLFARVKTFPWSDADHLGRSNRMAVHFSAMLSVFCRFLYDGKAPFFLYNSNLEGSGKGALVRMVLLPVFRWAGPDSIDPMDRKEVVNILNTKANSGAEYLWADEMPEGMELRDQNLARLATTDIWENRPMGQNKVVSKCDVTKMMVIFTGNRLTVNRNMQRRVLHADLFPHQTSNERKLPKDTVLLDSKFFSKAENLNKILSAMWAIVRLWDELGRPGTKDRWLESFEGWSEVIAGMVEAAQLGRPLVPFEAPGAGDDDTRSIKILVKAVIDTHCVRSEDGGPSEYVDSVTVTMKEIVACARKQGLFEDRLGTIDEQMNDLENKKGYKWATVDAADEFEMGKTTKVEPNEEQKREQAAGYLNEKAGSSWGKFFRRMAVNAQWFTGTAGVVYQFGDRTGKSVGSRFRLARVKQ